MVESSVRQLSKEWQRKHLFGVRTSSSHWLRWIIGIWHLLWETVVCCLRIKIYSHNFLYQAVRNVVWMAWGANLGLGAWFSLEWRENGVCFAAPGFPIQSGLATGYLNDSLERQGWGSKEREVFGPASDEECTGYKVKMARHQDNLVSYNAQEGVEGPIQSQMYY